MSRNFQAMYKVRMNEGNAENRRKSKGLERKNKRDDEVNKRRLLANMSPVTENNKEFSISKSSASTTGAAPTLGRKKATEETRVERLKRWREEKKKEADVKKKIAKSTFQYKKLAYTDDLALYKQSEVLSTKPNKQTSVLGSKVTNASRSTSSSGKDSTSNGKINKNADFGKTVWKPSAPTGKTTSTKQPVSKNAHQPILPVTRKSKPSDNKNKEAGKPVKSKKVVKSGEDVTSRLTRPTASAKAKMTEEKHSAFLKSKHQQVNTRGTVQRKATNKKEKEKPKVEIVKEDKLVQDSSGSQSDPHLSDSAVTSPKHSTPFPNKKQPNIHNLSPNKESSRRKSKRLIQTPKAKITDSASDTDINIDEQKTQKHENIEEKNDEQKNGIKGEAFNDIEMSSVIVNKSDPKTSPKLKENYKQTPNAKTPRRKSSRLVSHSNVESEITEEFVNSSKKAKANERNILEAAISSQQSETLSFQEPVPDLFVRDGSKRKSVRIALMASSSSENENEIENRLTPRKTPRRASRRRSKRQTPYKTEASSTPGVSSSEDFKCSDDSAIENVDVATLHFLGDEQKSISASQGNDGLIEDLFTPAYHIDKTSAVEDVSLRALQELCVEKVDGEVSFIEVPMDESSCNSPKINDSNSPTVVKDQSTQPFSPRKSGDITDGSTSQGSSLNKTPATDQLQNIELQFDDDQEVKATPPRTLRSRGRSLAPSSTFKEPGQPLSALRKSARRKTQYCPPSKTPEQMLAILKKSPMIEMNRRRSRHVSSPETSQSNFQNLLNNLPGEIERANKTAPADLMMEVNQEFENLTLPKDETKPTKEASASEMSYEEAQVTKVKPFRDLITTETERLNKLCEKWTEIKDDSPHISDDNLGQISSAIGKARLLMNQRFKQFSGLIDNCEFNTGEKKTNPKDLEGFWEMIYIQVEDVIKLFDDLEILQQNQWKSKEPTPVKKVITKKKSVVKSSKPKTKSNFAAFRAQLLKKKHEQTDVDIPAAEPVEPEVVKTFDAGFFAVSSPVRSPATSALKPSSQFLENQEQDAAKEEILKVGPHTPAKDKENELDTPKSQKFTSIKRLRYAPTVDSPLLNDITDM